MKKVKLTGIVALLITAVAFSAVTVANERTTGRGTGPVVWVMGQDLFYDSIVIVEVLPQHGNFQQLLPGVGPSGLATEFGPGDVGYLGGRWWVDGNENGIMDEEDVYFLCPLLCPGRSEP